MTATLTKVNYAQTKSKFARLERRLANLEKRTDLSELHRDEARASYLTMICQYKRELKLIEKAIGAANDTAAVCEVNE